MSINSSNCSRRNGSIFIIINITNGFFNIKILDDISRYSQDFSYFLSTVRLLFHLVSLFFDDLLRLTPRSEANASCFHATQIHTDLLQIATGHAFDSPCLYFNIHFIVAL